MRNDSSENYTPEKDNSISLGSRIRDMRYQRGIGIKRLAPELKVNYSYLSKLENNKVAPSTELIERISTYFAQDKEELMLLANKVPEDIMRILRENPQQAPRLLRESFANDGKQG